MRKEFVAAGFGGQGIVVMGITACVAAGLYDRKQSTQTQSYGSAARGGACRTDVVISDETIDYAKAISPDVMVIMSNPARDKYIGELDPEKGTVIVDSTIVQDLPPAIKRVYRIPATEIAELKLGARIAANMVMLGAVSAISGIISKQALESAAKENKNPKIVETNLKAIEEGYNYGESLL